MAKKEKYKLNPAYEGREIVASFNPEFRKNGRYNLSECSQRDLKYLHDVEKYPGVIIDDETEKTADVGKEE